MKKREEIGRLRSSQPFPGGLSFLESVKSFLNVRLMTIIAVILIASQIKEKNQTNSE
jgi:hypothetical protein